MLMLPHPDVMIQVIFKVMLQPANQAAASLRFPVWILIDLFYKAPVGIVFQLNCVLWEQSWILMEERGRSYGQCLVVLRNWGHGKFVESSAYILQQQQFYQNCTILPRAKAHKMLLSAPD